MLRLFLGWFVLRQLMHALARSVSLRREALVHQRCRQNHQKPKAICSFFKFILWVLNKMPVVQGELLSVWKFLLFQKFKCVWKYKLTWTQPKATIYSIQIQYSRKIQRTANFFSKKLLQTRTYPSQNGEGAEGEAITLNITLLQLLLTLLTSVYTRCHGLPYTFCRMANKKMQIQRIGKFALNGYLFSITHRWKYVAV